MALLSLFALHSPTLARDLDRGREFRQKPSDFPLLPLKLISPRLSHLPDLAK